MHGDGRSKAAMLGQPADSDGVITELVLGENKQPLGLLPRPSTVLLSAMPYNLLLITELAILLCSNERRLRWRPPRRTAASGSLHPWWTLLHG